jgi:very-short-patch-repair endonuclease
MSKKIIPYNPKLVPLARELRNNSTLSEVLLWMELGNKQFMGYDFDRQKPIDRWLCKTLKFVILSLSKNLQGTVKAF